MLLNSADALRLGSAVVDRVYVGAAQVWPAAVTRYLFPSDAGGRPATPTVETDTGSLNIGLIFACTVAGTRVTGLDVYIPAGVTMQPSLHAGTSGTATATGPAFTATATGWVRLPFTTAANLQTGVSYTASVYMASNPKYLTISGRFPATVGPLNNSATLSGRYSYSSQARPTTAVATWYGIDVVAEPA